MTKPKFKDLCDAVESIEKVTSQTELRDALPKMFALSHAIKSMADLIKTGEKQFDALAAKCTKYALKYPSCFDDGLLEKSGATTYGNITIGRDTYHFSHGFRDFKRLEEGCVLGQAFINALPDAFKRPKYELNKTELSKLSADELASLGLKRGENDVWSL